MVWYGGAVLHHLGLTERIVNRTSKYIQLGGHKHILCYILLICFLFCYISVLHIPVLFCIKCTFPKIFTSKSTCLHCLIFFCVLNNVFLYIKMHLTSKSLQYLLAACLPKYLIWYCFNRLCANQKCSWSYNIMIT